MTYNLSDTRIKDILISYISSLYKERLDGLSDLQLYMLCDLPEKTMRIYNTFGIEFNKKFIDELAGDSKELCTEPTIKLMDLRYPPNRTPNHILKAFLRGEEFDRDYEPLYPDYIPVIKSKYLKYFKAGLNCFTATMRYNNGSNGTEFRSIVELCNYYFYSTVIYHIDSEVDFPEEIYNKYKDSKLPREETVMKCKEEILKDIFETISRR